MPLRGDQRVTETRDAPKHARPETDGPPPAGGGEPWWRSAVFYQVYPKSFADGNGDGIGDLIGLRDRLDYLEQLGVDALWLSPFFRTPDADGGYDVSDPTDVDPMFGTIADYDALLAAAHARGIRVTIDLVPNHVSTEHAWFRAALTAGRGSPERARFLFRDGEGSDGARPPNNWPSVFGGPAWTRVPDGQWYLHLFAPEQPDLDWTNPEVTAEFDRVLRFWLDRGTDGFRVDVAHGMAKQAGLPWIPIEVMARIHDRDHDRPPEDPRWDQEEVHGHLRGFRRILDSYPGDRMAVGEVWAAGGERLARYVRPDELNLAFNFQLVEATWSADQIRAAIDDALMTMGAVGAPCCWVLSNHDVVRHVTRFGDGPAGTARARAAALVQLALPGAVYLYNGDELGLPNVSDLPDEALRDPTWERSGHTERGRDGQRIPLPWDGAKPPFGFSTTTDTWLPVPETWRELTVSRQLDDEESTLSLYRRAIDIRAKSSTLHDGEFTWIGAPDGTLAFRRGTDFVVAVNLAGVPAPMPPGEIVLASGPIDLGLLPPDTAVWLRV
jgi:alpha-glucosidase